MKNQIIINDKEMINKLKKQIIDITNEKVKELFDGGTGILLLKKIKFTQFGYDPLFERPLNFIEQTNQTFTYLVSLLAVEKLLSLYPDEHFKINFGTQCGYDIESLNGEIICECFSSTSPDSNSKLKKDVERVAKDENAKIKYVIFYSEIPKYQHVDNLRSKYENVQIIQLQSLGI